MFAGAARFRAGRAIPHFAFGAAYQSICVRNETGNLTIKRFVPAAFALLSIG